MENKLTIKHFFQSHRATFNLAWTLFSGLILDTIWKWANDGKVDWHQVFVAAVAIVLAYMRSPHDRGVPVPTVGATVSQSTGDTAVAESPTNTAAG